MQRAYSLLTLKAVDESKRILTGIATTPSTDRSGDVVEPEGAEFSLPIPFLWQHDSRQPIGQVTKAKVTKAGIEVEVQLAQTDEPGTLKDRLDEAWQSIKLGLVRGLSIGFSATETARIENTYGLRFIKWLWLELSSVTIAANGDCSVTAIKSADEAALRAVSGAPARGRSVRLDPAFKAKNLPGVPGKQNTPIQKGNIVNIAEQIAAYKAQREQKAARMNEIMEKSGADLATLDEKDDEEYSVLQTEVESIDKHLTRLKSHEAFMVTKQAVVVDEKAGREGGSVELRGGHQVSVKSNLPPGIRFTRFTIAMAAAKGNIMQAHEIAKVRFKETPEVINALHAAISLGSTRDLNQKAAVAFGTTTDSGFAGPLVQYQDMESEFVALLRPKSILGRMNNLRRVPFMMRAARQLTGVSGAFVGEGLPKPVGKQTYDNVTLSFAKAAVIVVLSDELVRFSNPDAEILARDDMIAGISTYLDKRFIDPSYSGVVNVSPASITNGATRVQSSGTTLAAIDADVRSMMAMFATSDVDPSTAAWVMSPTTALRLSMKRTTQDELAFPTISMTGGTWYGLPVITSTSMAAAGSPNENQIALITQGEVFFADDGGISIDMSMEASVQMSDTPSAGAASLVSLWQNNLLGIRAERYINWAPRRPNSLGIALLENVAY